MALFGGIRDARFLAAINSELINAIIDTEIEFYKLIVEKSASNMYGESESKAYYDSILIPCVITKEGKTAGMDDYGHSYTRTAQFAISRDILERASFYPEVGDIAGKNPETWPNGDQFGYSVSVLCDAHATRQTPTGITNLRRGGNNASPAYKK
jgi:hypothetical protein